MTSNKSMSEDIELKVFFTSQEDRENPKEPSITQHEVIIGPSGNSDSHSSSETNKDKNPDHVLKSAMPYITETMPSGFRKITEENDGNKNVALFDPLISTDARDLSVQNASRASGLLKNSTNRHTNASVATGDMNNGMTGRKSGSQGMSGFPPVVSEETKTSKTAMINPFYNPFNSMPVCYDVNLAAPSAARQNFNPYQMMPLPPYGYPPPMPPWFGMPPPQPFPVGPSPGIMPYMPAAPPQDPSPNHLIATDQKKHYYICNPVSSSSSSPSNMPEAEIRKTFDAFNLQDLVRQAPVTQSK